MRSHVRVKYSAKQERKLKYEGEFTVSDLVVLRRELRSYQTPNEKWDTPVRNGYFEDSHGKFQQWKETHFDGELRSSYLDAIPLESQQEAQQIIDNLIADGFDGLKGTQVMLSKRKTKHKAGLVYFDEKQIVLYHDFQSYATLLHELSHIISYYDSGCEDHSVKFSETLLQLWRRFE